MKLRLVASPPEISVLLASRGGSISDSLMNARDLARQTFVSKDESLLITDQIQQRVNKDTRTLFVVSISQDLGGTIRAVNAFW